MMVLVSLMTGFHLGNYADASRARERELAERDAEFRRQFRHLNWQPLFAALDSKVAQRAVQYNDERSTRQPRKPPAWALQGCSGYPA